jgi:hypothetical protein
MTHKFAVHLEQLHQLVKHVKAAAHSLKKLQGERLAETVLVYASYLAKKGNAGDSRAFLGAADALREMDLGYSRTVLEAFVADLEPHLDNALAKLEAHFGKEAPSGRRAKRDVDFKGEITLAELTRLARQSGLITSDADAFTAMEEFDFEDDEDEIALGSDDSDFSMDDSFDMEDDSFDMEDDDDLDDADLEDFGDDLMDFEEEEDLDVDLASRSSRFTPSRREMRKRRANRSSAPTRRTRRKDRYV